MNTNTPPTLSVERWPVPVSSSTRLSVPLIPLDLHHLLVPDHLDLRIREGPLLQDLRGPELVAPVHDVDLARVAGEIVRLLHRGVAPADDGEHLALEERAVAHRAVRH